MLRFTPEPEKSSGPFTSCLYFVSTSTQTTSGASRSPPQWKVGRVVGAAAAVVDGGLRIRAQRPRPRDDAAARGLRADLRRRHSVFDPVDEGIEQVLRLRR